MYLWVLNKAFTWGYNVDAAECDNSDNQKWKVAGEKDTKLCYCIIIFICVCYDIAIVFIHLFFNFFTHNCSITYENVYLSLPGIDILISLHIYSTLYTLHSTLHTKRRNAKTRKTL